MKPDLNIALSRLFASLIVPGFIAAGPYLFVLQEVSPDIHKWLFNGSFGATSVIVLIVVAAGLLMEELGSSLEWILWKRCKFGMESKTREDEWYKYLNSPSIPETLADHIAHVVSRLKWEFAGGFAFIVGAIPMLAPWMTKIRNQGPAWPDISLASPWVILFVIQFLVGLFLLIMGRFTMGYLVDIRTEFLRPSNAGSAQEPVSVSLSITGPGMVKVSTTPPEPVTPLPGETSGAT